MIYKYKYDTIPAFESDLHKAYNLITSSKKSKKNKCDYGKKAIYDERQSFFGTENYQVSAELMRNGDEEIVDKFDNVFCAQKYISVRNVRNVCGGAVNVPAAVLNLPNCMMQRKKVESVAKNIDLYYNVTVSGATDKDSMIAAATNVMRLFNALRAKNNVSLYLCMCVTDNKGENTMYLSIKLCESNKNVNIMAISYYLCHPSFFRRQLFVMLGTPETWGTKAYVRAANAADFTDNKNAIYIDYPRACNLDSNNINNYLK